MAIPCPISAVFPLHTRVEAALKTLAVLKSCNPAPAEILVCMDNCPEGIAERIHAFHPDVRLLENETNLGPGGSRNKLFAAASHELIANFDDDSFPAHADFFARVWETAQRFPEAAVISASSQPDEWKTPFYLQIAIPSGCGCVFRKSWFERTTGYVPLPIAYSMEEVDVGLQLHAAGGQIIHDPQLRVIHDHGPLMMVNELTNATVLANTALFPYLRFPVWLWPIGLWQIARRIAYLLSQKWTRGLGAGLRMIPKHLQRHRMYQKIMPGVAILSWLRLRYRPVILTPAPPIRE